jgi:hypothetical protein
MPLIYKSERNNYYIDTQGVVTKYNNKTQQTSIIKPYLFNSRLYISLPKPTPLDNLYIIYILEHDITGCYITSYHLNNDLHNFEGFKYDICRTKKGYEYKKTNKYNINGRESQNPHKIYTLSGNGIGKSSKSLKDFEEFFTDEKYIRYLQLIENQPLTYLGFTLKS